MNLCPKCYRELLLKKQDNSSSDKSTVSASVAVHLSHIVSDNICTESPRRIPESSAETSTGRICSPSPAVEGNSDLDASRSSSLHPVSPESDSMKSVAPIASLLHPDLLSRDGPQSVPRRRDTNRCLVCKKRMGILGFKCRCGNIFCATHRYSDKHGCSFDYKSAGREAILKANPIVKAAKLQKI
ncbi:hypothetical protein KP509_38G045200 [Ceratopteris richardii]|nr:hypothetical protein KP509_38G045200 [Ceratopteris richardii]